MSFSKRKQPMVLLLDTEIDGKVNFTGTSALLPEIQVSANGTSNKERTRGAVSLPPVAGSKDWLPALVTAALEEVIVRDSMERCTGGHESDSPDVFFAVDLECVLHKYRRWHHCFPRIKPFYAVKCNPNRAVVSALAMTSGCGFDCASPAEIDLVLGCGVDPSRIIYANPCKEMAALRHTLSAGVTTMTFDSEDELLKIRRLLDARAQQASIPVASVQVVLRLRVPDAYSDCPLGEKYGAPEEACSDLIASTVDLGFDLVGVSFHCGSGCQDAQAYPAALEVAKRVFDLAAGQGIQLTLLDIGGGFPGWDGSEYVYEGGGSEEGITSPPPLSLEEIGEITRPVLDELFPPVSGVKVIAEPGRYFVEASHVLFTRIYAKRPIAMRVCDSEGGEGGESVVETKKALFINEGVDGCFKDTVLFGVYFEPCPIPFLSGLPHAVAVTGEKRLPSVEKEDGEEDFVVMGPSGSPADVVARKRLPKSLGPGDWLFFSRMGAYTSSIASVASSAAVRTSCFYVASSPADPREGVV